MTLRNDIVHDYNFEVKGNKIYVIKYFANQSIGRRTLFRLLKQYKHHNVDIDPNYGKGVWKFSQKNLD